MQVRFALALCVSSRFVCVCEQTGQRVCHQHFGLGTVLAVHHSSCVHATVRFDDPVPAGVDHTRHGIGAGPHDPHCAVVPASVLFVTSAPKSFLGWRSLDVTACGLFGQPAGARPAVAAVLNCLFLMRESRCAVGTRRHTADANATAKGALLTCPRLSRLSIIFIRVLGMLRVYIQVASLPR